MLREAEKLAFDWEQGRREGGIQDLISAAHANRISEAVLAVVGEPDAEQCLRRMADKSVNLSSRTPSQGKDALWELDLLSFMRRRGVTAILKDPPDILADFGFGDYPLACKKVYSEKGVEAQMRKGVKQLSGFGGAGLVAFNIDDLVPESVVLQSRSQNDASDFLANLNRSFIERHQMRLQRFVTEGRCDGVLVATSILADIANSSQRFNNFLQVTIWTLSEMDVARRSRLDVVRTAFVN